MKKPIMIIASSLSLAACIAISSFAWFRLANNGSITTDVDTQVMDGITLSFTPYDELEGTLVPSKMKKGVINNYLGKDTDGYYTGKLDLLRIASGEQVLPKTNPHKDGHGKTLYYEYELDEQKKLKVKPSEDGRILMEEPSTILYRQFQLNLGSTTEGEKSASFEMSIQYYDIFDKPQNLMQSDAISFSFYLMQKEIGEEGLSSDNLTSLSTTRKDCSSKKTLSQLFYTNQNLKLVTFKKTNNSVYTLNGVESFNLENQDSYHIVPLVSETDEGFKLSFDVKGLSIKNTYYMITEIYYNLPDELLEGVLSLTERLNVAIDYKIVTNTYAEKQNEGGE